MNALGFQASVSPDGSKIAFVRGTCRTEREAYRGPANRDIWVFDKVANTYQQLTTFEGNEFSPEWLDDSSILFISPKSGKYNLHRISLAGEETQLTTETEFGINTFNLSKSSGKAVYQVGGNVNLFDLSTNTSNQLAINVSSDFRFDPVVTKNISDQVESFSVSPDGEYMVYAHRGEIYVTRNDKEDKRSVRLTTTAAREQQPIWYNDETILFTSDQNDQFDIFAIRSSATEKNLFKSLKHETIPVISSDDDEFDLSLSPDGKKLVYRQGRGKLLVSDISDELKLSKTITLQDTWDTPGQVDWSPDSKWVAYSLADLYFNNEIYIHPIDNSTKPVNVSMHPKGDYRPKWSPDGSKLGFISERNNGDADVWFAWLTKSDYEKSKEQWRRASKEEEEKKEEESTIEVTIDFDGLYKRLVQVTSFVGNETDFSFDDKGESIYYTIGGSGRQDYKQSRNLFKIKWDGSDNEEIIGGDKSPNSLSLSKDGSYVYANTSGGKITRIKTKDDKTENLSVSSKLAINYQGERSQIFEEGWRALRDGFYDPNFHGNDWSALKNKYKPLAMAASTKEDFQYQFNLMLGQLNASHMGMYRGDNQKETQSQRSGMMGVEGLSGKDGFEITYVLEGSPASRKESKLDVGDVIMSINQQSVSGTQNFYDLLLDKAEEPVLMEVKRKKGSIEEVVIWPVSNLSSLLYDDWVESRRKLVDTYSSGKLGYLHIRGMNWTSFERFERELTAAGAGKEGIVIDVRYNGGGWTTDYLMAVLNVKQHAYTVPRGAAKSLEAEHQNFKNTYPFSERLPLAAWTKPSIALCNENSYSNAEIFSHAYKTLGMGTLVGQPTFGAVISTGGWSLVDGSYVRMPFRAWYVKATEENMEHGPAVPDILVENPPAYRANNIDPQLKRSVDELLGQL
ncbi:MAG: C-terminal processing protease CtpA/Prc/Tol biopolymer transport system component [Cyclobacteriaceae bacterium]|jgi:C-terminal processing protease CtpA/Prc/Tol biopolymer transport system component